MISLFMVHRCFTIKCRRLELLDVVHMFFSLFSSGYDLWQVSCQFVNLTRWKVAICGEYMKSGFKVYNYIDDIDYYLIFLYFVFWIQPSAAGFLQFFFSVNEKEKIIFLLFVF